MASEVVWDPRSGRQAATATAQLENQQGNATDPRSILHYEEQFKVLICKEHGYALQNLAEHLRKHHAVNAQDRQQIVQEYSNFELLRPQDVPLPEPIGKPFDSLRKPVKALTQTSLYHRLQ